MKFLVTGGAGFIGSSLIRTLILKMGHHVINIDKLTYASNLNSLNLVKDSNLYQFEKADIANYSVVKKIFKKYKPDIVIHLAAESHVDKSIDEPFDFIQSNIVGTFNLLEVSREYWQENFVSHKNDFRFHHISTDEVFGDLKPSDALFCETTPYNPSSPYSASKASSDHLVRAWGRTYGLPYVISNCSNNYGPYQNPEKLIPLMISNAIKGKQLPIYGKGNQIRDWLYVDDHAKAIIDIAINADNDKTYTIGGNNEKTNLEVVKTICDILDNIQPCKIGGIEKYSDLIKFVDDRPGHDYRYAIDSSLITKDLGWIPNETFETGIYKTVLWYIDNKDFFDETNSYISNNNEK